MYGTYSHVKYGWENGLKEEEKAKNCIECGRCETLCPQKLSIRQDLKKAQADLDGAMCAACGKRDRKRGKAGWRGWPGSDLR